MYNSLTKKWPSVLSAGRVYNLRAHKLRYSNSSARRYARSYFTFATTLDGSNLLLPFLLIATSLSFCFCCVCVLLCAGWAGRSLAADYVPHKRAMCAPPLRCSADSAPFTFHLHALRNYLSLAARSKSFSSTSSLLACGRFLLGPKNKLLHIKETSKLLCEEQNIYVFYRILSHNVIFLLKCAARIAPQFQWKYYEYTLTILSFQIKVV